MKIQGSSVIGDAGVNIQAGGDVNIVAAQTAHSENHFLEQKGSGFSFEGAGITYGSQQQSIEQDQEDTRSVASTVGAIAGDVNITAGQAYNQVGSDVLAPAGNINIAAQDVSITEARETSRTEIEQKFKKSGVTLAMGGAGVALMQTLSTQMEAAENTKDARMQGLAAANSALAVNNAMKDAELSAGSKGPSGEGEGSAASAANLTLSIGASSSHSQSLQAGDGARGTTTDIQNRAHYSASTTSVGAGGGVEGKNKGISGVGVGVGRDSDSASSTTTAGISGMAGNAAIRSTDAETGIARIFDKEAVQKEVDAQARITEAFSREAPKAVASYAAGRMADLTVEFKASEGNPGRQAEIQEEIKRWDEGGVYRVGMHTVVGGLGGGIGGAAGAATIGFSANAMNAWQDGMEQGLVALGFDGTTAKVMAQGVATVTAAGVGAVVGGTYGAASAATVDANNRQLHPSEKQKLKELAMSTGLSEEKLTRAACYAVQCWAQYPEGSEERNVNFVGVTEANGLGKELSAIQAAGNKDELFDYTAIDRTKDVFTSTALPVAKNTAKTIEGGLAVATGSTICGTSGIGCLAGGPLAIFGASEATEGATGLYKQYQGQGVNGFNPIRSGLDYIFPVWGDTIYDASYLLLSAGALGASVPLKVGASDGINRGNSIFGVTVPRWQNPVVNPLTQNILLPRTAAQGVLLYGVGAKAPGVMENVKKVQDQK